MQERERNIFLPMDCGSSGLKTIGQQQPADGGEGATQNNRVPEPIRYFHSRRRCRNSQLRHRAGQILAHRGSIDIKTTCTVVCWHDIRQTICATKIRDMPKTRGLSTTAVGRRRWQAYLKPKWKIKKSRGPRLILSHSACSIARSIQASNLRLQNIFVVCGQQASPSSGLKNNRNNRRRGGGGEHLTANRRLCTAKIRSPGTGNS